MTKIILASLMLFAMACGGKSEMSEQKTASTADSTAASFNTVAAKKYACPMHCEGEKTYAEAGKCPVCKMDLLEVAMAETDSTTHNH